MKTRKGVLPLMAAFILGFSSCSKDDGPAYSATVLKNTELMTVLKSKGYIFNQEGKLELNDKVNATVSLDLSGTKIADFTGLDILPNLKEVKLSDNGYGPSFDFAKLPKQITGIDLTGNNIHNYDNLVKVEVEENGDETVTNLRDITKLYLPAEAKFNIKDLVRFYRKNEENIKSGKMDVKMIDDNGALSKYNTLRTVPDEKIRANFKKHFSSIFADDGIHIDINKQLSIKDKLNACVLNKYSGVDAAETLQGIQYIVNSPYWDGKMLTIDLANTAKLPYIKPGSGITTMSFSNVDASAGIDFGDATNLTCFQWVKVNGISEIDLSHSVLFGQRSIEMEQNGPYGSSLAFIDCPDLKKITLPEKSGLRAFRIALANLKSLEQVDLSKFKLVSEFGLGNLPGKCSIVYPVLTEFHTYSNYTEFACTQDVFDKQSTKDFIKKYYNMNPPRLRATINIWWQPKIRGIRWSSQIQ